MFVARRSLVIGALALLPTPAFPQYYRTFGPNLVRIGVHASRGWMSIVADRQNFLIQGDSAQLAAWADSARALVGRHGSARFAYFDSTLQASEAMTLRRVSDDSTSDYDITGEDGASKGTLRVPFDSARALLAALHGIGAYRPPPPVPSGIDPHPPGLPFFDFEVQRQAEPRPGQRGPEYPQDLRRQRISGQVLAQFVVDTTGHPDLKTFRLLKVTNPEFGAAVRASLVRAQFFPAELEGHLVAELVQQPFAFTIGN